MQPPDTPLSPRGLLQARAVAERLRAEALSALWSSDLPRAWQTADAIARACGLAALPQPLLHERNFGDLRGRAYDSLGFDPLAMLKRADAALYRAKDAGRARTLDTSFGVLQAA